ncbi:MAG: cation diffusion facilitator family transporter [Vicinamibacterales bacterium]
MAHAHSGSAAGRHRRPLVITLVLTTGYLVAEVVGGLLTGSLALLADAGHMLTDVGGLALALFAIWFAGRPATPDRTYGFYRAEILAALANAVVLILISIYILIEAYRRFQDPPAVASGWMLAVAVVGLVVNAAGILLLRSGSGESLNLQGAYYEVLSDTLSSLGVIAAAAVMWTTGWRYADPLVSAAIGLFILPRTWRLMRQAVGVLLEGTPSEVDIDAVREALGRIDGVAGVHDLHVWSLTSGINALSVHLTCAQGAGRDALLEQVHRDIRDAFPIQHVTVQLEAPGADEPDTHQ